MKTRIQNGFTLVEMAIVLAIVALILGTSLTLLSAQQDQRRIEDTRDRLNAAQEALIGFAITNGRLPCPADPTIATGAALAGHEAATCTTSPNTTGGVLPWVTLGIGETDAWGRRFTYSVTNIYADPISANTLGNDNNPSYSCTSANLCTLPTPPGNPQFSSFALCSCGGLNILSAATGGTNIATNMPAVIVSHGANGLGAYTPAGLQIPVPAANANETENANNDATFVSHTIALAGEAGGYFDDQVTWLSPNILFNRMVQAGKLP